MIQMTHLEVTLIPKLRLEQALKNAGVENPATITHLAVAGTLIGRDFKYMRKMKKTLQELDMGKALVAKFESKKFQGTCKFHIS
jgi:hypothetical protein